MTWTLDWEGITIGGSGPYKLRSLDGVGALPNVRTSDSARPRSAGEWPGTDYLSGRTISADIDVNAPHPADQVWRPLLDSLVTGVERPLRFAIPGIAGGRQLRSNVRVRRRNLRTGQTFTYGWTTCSVEWRATDPRLFDDQATVLSAAVQSLGGPGVQFDAEFDLDFGGPGQGSGGVLANNAGNFPAPWTLTVTGPAENVRVARIGGGLIRTVGQVGAGDTLVVDSLTRSITLNGSSRYSWLVPNSRWFDLTPGANQLRWSAQSGTGQGTLTFRSAWV